MGPPLVGCSRLPSQSVLLMHDGTCQFLPGENGGNTVLSRRSEIAVTDDRSGLIGEVSLAKLLVG